MNSARRGVTALASCATIFAPALLLASDGPLSLALYSGLSGNLAVLLIILLPEPIRGI